MNDDEQNQISVSFPATPVFTRIGRVAVAGLALRLKVDIGMVEKLRLAVDTAVQALQGEGRVDVDASWEAELLTVCLTNSQITIDRQSELAEELATLVGGATVDANSITLRVDTTS